VGKFHKNAKIHAFIKGFVRMRFRRMIINSDGVDQHIRPSFPPHGFNMSFRNVVLIYMLF